MARIKIKTADLMDHFQDELQSFEIQFNSYGGRMRFHGPCQTVRCREDNVRLKQVLSEPGQGQILMVDGGGSLRTALMGDMIADMGKANNWAGVVIHGAVRDTVALKQVELGIKALGSNPRKSQKTGAGETNVEIRFGGITVKPGDWVYCDEDGVVVANRELPLDRAGNSLG